MDILLNEDYSKVNEIDFIDWSALHDKTIYITGATGLIGKTIVKLISYIGRQKQLNIKMILLVRSLRHAKELFLEEIGCGEIELAEGNVEHLPEIKQNVDYIIHGASQTDSRMFIDHPTQTIETAVIGTNNLLKMAEHKKVLGFVYLSSMEVYGTPERGHKVTEEDIGKLLPTDSRNSYPISKLLCEALCCAYSCERGVPTRAVRLAQTYGPGVHHNDKRLFAYIGQCVREKKSIVLRTKGDSERSYLYSIDAAIAILTVLLKGKDGEIYNVADENTYCSVSEMAEQIAKEYGLAVEYENGNAKESGFPETFYLDLDTNKIRSLGWKPAYGM